MKKETLEKIQVIILPIMFGVPVTACEEVHTGCWHSLAKRLDVIYLGIMNIYPNAILTIQIFEHATDKTFYYHECSYYDEHYKKKAEGYRKYLPEINYN